MTIDRPDLIGPETYLETIVDMGYTATETGPPGTSHRTARRRWRRRGASASTLIATFLPLRLDDPEGFEEDLKALDRTVEVLEATGGGILLLADMETAERARAAGSPERQRATGGTRRRSTGPPSGCMRAAGLVTSRGPRGRAAPARRDAYRVGGGERAAARAHPRPRALHRHRPLRRRRRRPDRAGAAPCRPDPPPAPEGRRRRSSRPLCRRARST